MGCGWVEWRRSWATGHVGSVGFIEWAVRVDTASGVSGVKGVGRWDENRVVDGVPGDNGGGAGGRLEGVAGSAA